MSYVTDRSILKHSTFESQGEDLIHPFCGSQKNKTITDESCESVALKTRLAL
jgi:hypothetical protein